jgi:hypothetical protein
MDNRRARRSDKSIPLEDFFEKIKVYLYETIPCRVYQRDIITDYVC